MYTNLFSIIIVTLINILSLLLSVWVFRSSPKEKTNRWFLLMSIFIVLWVDSSYIASIAVNDDQLSLLFYRLNGAAVPLFLYVFYEFFINFLDTMKQRRLISYTLLGMSVIFAVLSLFTKYIVSGVYINQQASDVIFGSLNDYLNIFSCAVAILILYIAVTRYIGASLAEKRKIKYFFIGTLIFIIANIIFNILVPAITGSSKYQRLGDFSFIFFSGFTAYAIVRQRLFDVKFAIVRSVTYTLVLATLACAYLVIVLLSATLISRNLTASEQVISGAAVSLILVFAFQPIKQFFDRATNKIFYKDRYNMDEFYARINDALMLNTDLRGILERTASEIATTLKSEQVFFFISTKNEHYVSAGTSGHNQLPNDDVVKIAELRGTDYRTVAASILNSDDPLRQIMVRHKIEIMIPLVRADSIIGYLCLGYQLSSDGYASRDIKALNMITDELIIAVQNALAVQEVRELNLTLKQRIADATKELRMSNNRLRNLDKAKDEFVSVAAHELRTPMTVMRGFINLLQRKQLGEVNSQQLEILEKMNTNAKNLIDLVNNMLDLSKLEANRLVIQKSDNFLNDLVGEAMEKISLLYEAKGLGLVYDKASVRINTDTEKFERVLVNLLSNAYKFTPAGGSVTISSTIDEETRMVTMCVTDTGMGIPADSIDKLFKKFSQVDNYLQKTSGGTGLGLSICKQMVEKLGGKIWVESTPDVGSRFYFTTPMSDDLIKE
jgi:signal transduction histidine kinase